MINEGFVSMNELMGRKPAVVLVKETIGALRLQVADDAEFVSCPETYAGTVPDELHKALKNEQAKLLKLREKLEKKNSHDACPSKTLIQVKGLPDTVPTSLEFGKDENILATIKQADHNLEVRFINPGHCVTVPTAYLKMDEELLLVGIRGKFKKITPLHLYDAAKETLKGINDGTASPMDVDAPITDPIVYCTYANKTCGGIQVEEGSLVNKARPDLSIITREQVKSLFA